jgi:hypothetical protein
MTMRYIVTVIRSDGSYSKEEYYNLKGVFDVIRGLNKLGGEYEVKIVKE